MNAQEIAKRIVAEDMGARKQAAFIRENWNGRGFIEDFAAEVSEAVAALIGIAQ